MFSFRKMDTGGERVSTPDATAVTGAYPPGPADPDPQETLGSPESRHWGTRDFKTYGSWKVLGTRISI